MQATSGFTRGEENLPVGSFSHPVPMGSQLEPPVGQLGASTLENVTKSGPSDETYPSHSGHSLEGLELGNNNTFVSQQCDIVGKGLFDGQKLTSIPLGGGEDKDVWRVVGKGDPEQEKFENALETIRGTGLFDGQKLTSIPLDGREMIAQIAGERINFPLAKISLEDYSLEELSGALCFALNDNISALDEKIANLKSKAEPFKRASLAETITYLENYKTLVEEGSKILASVLDNKKEEIMQSDHLKEIKEYFFKKYFFDIIKYLDQSFTAHDQALTALASGNTSRATYLSYQGLARFMVTKELAKPKPRYKIFGGYQKSFELYGKAVEALASGNIARAACLSNQAMVCFKNIEESAQPQPRENIARGYEQSFELYGKAVEALASGNIARGACLSNQAIVCFKNIEESAQPQPRENIARGYEQSFELCGQALHNLALGNIMRSEYLNKQGYARFKAIEESAQPQPRENIARGYEQSFELYGQALHNLALGNIMLSEYLNNQGYARFKAIEELKQPQPRENIAGGYEQIFELYGQAVEALALGNTTRAISLNNEGLALLDACREMEATSVQREHLSRI